jgi:hypothetical protein
MIIFAKMMEPMAKKKVENSIEPSQNMRQLPIGQKENAGGEVVIYNPDDSIRLEVRLENDTVWLNRDQLSILFNRDKKTIGKHINNALQEELLGLPTIAKFATLQQEGERWVNRTKEFYNLDMILSVGYRVKSARGVAFRRWASTVLKEYLLRGYSINPRLEQLERRVAKTEEKIDFFVKTALPPVAGVFYDGQIFQAYEFASRLIKSAKSEIVLIDNYVDESVLTMLDKREPGVDASIYTLKISNQFQLDIAKHDAQYPAIQVKVFTKAHDRFLIIDDKIYHIGASLKDLGKKWFAFSLMENLAPADLISRLI